MNAAVLALAGMGLVAGIGAISAFVSTRPLAGGVTTGGTIVEVKREQTTVSGRRPGMITYAPVIEFADNVGTRHRVVSSLSGGARPVVGAPVQVSYLPENPEKSRIVGGAGLAGAKYAFGVVALLCLSGALAVALH